MLSPVTPPATSATTTLPASEPAAATLSPAPPSAGVDPAPQTPVQATVDLLNRFGHLRLDLLQQTEAALAHIHLNQLASLPREAEHRLVEWLFDIPVRRGDTIDLWSARVYRDSDAQSQQRDRPVVQWRVQLAFDLPGLGPMQAQISLQGERVATRFWATEASTLPLLRRRLHELRRDLLAAGLEVGDLDCQQGAIPGSASVALNPLIDEQTLSTRKQPQPLAVVLQYDGERDNASPPRDTTRLPNRLSSWRGNTTSRYRKTNRWRECLPGWSSARKFPKRCILPWHR